MTVRGRDHENTSCPSALLRVFVAALSVGPAACAQHYSSTGLILRIDRPGSLVTISHDAFPGFMDAMTMPFDLKGAAREVALKPGDRVRFRLAVKSGPGGRSWVDRVEVTSAAAVDAGLQQTPAAPVLVPVGSPMPDFELTDQSGALGMKLLAGAKGLKRLIREPTVNRPGLALAGFTKYFASKRVQVIGSAESTFLKSISKEERVHRYADLFSYKIPCVVFSRMR